MPDEPNRRPCDFDRHEKAATCDCRICGWHVWDTRTMKNASGQVVVDGSVCINGRPKAVDYHG